MNKDFYSTVEVAKQLGISRIAVFQKIKKGEIQAKRSGRSFLISKKDIEYLLPGSVSAKGEEIIAKAVKKTAKEYGETLRLLGKE